MLPAGNPLRVEMVKRNQIGIVDEEPVVRANGGGEVLGVARLQDVVDQLVDVLVGDACEVVAALPVPSLRTPAVDLLETGESDEGKDLMMTS